MVAFMMLFVGILIGIFLERAFVRRELEERYKRARFEMKQFRDGDGRRSFWSGTANALSLMWFELCSLDEWSASDKWRKLVGE